MDTSAQTESILDLMKSIKKEQIVLPEFQRDFVWELGKTYDLFDSLVKNIFIGSIIYGVPSFEITTREIDTRPRTGEGSKRKLKITSYKKAEINQKVKTSGFRLLLDGQQRITSIYRALLGHDHVWFIAKPQNDVPENFSAATLEEILSEFSGKESREECLSIKLSDVFDMMEHDYLEDEIKTKFFDILQYPQLVQSEEKKPIFRQYLSIAKKLQDLFKSQKLVSYYLLDTTLEKFALFFERSNSRGIQLNFIDILAAKLYEGFNLREHIQDFKEQYPHYEINKEIIVRAISFLVSGGKDIERSYILQHLSAEDFSKYWKAVCEWYRKTLDFLYENHFILSQSWIPYENMLIPLMMFLKEIGGVFSQMTEKQLKFIRFWYWSSIFAQRYTGSSNEIIIQDALILISISHGEKITDRNYFYKLKCQIGTADELHSFTKKGSVLYRGVLNLINYRAGGLLDWMSTTKLSFNQDKIEDHHIFPRKYISSAYQNNEEALALTDSVVNRTLIPKLTNIKIGAQTPSSYLKELLKKNSNLKQSLENHLIPSELLDGTYDQDYLFFVEERAERIFQIIQEYVITMSDEIRSEFYHEPRIFQELDKIHVWGAYYNKKLDADFYPELQQVLYQGKMYSPSGAANIAKKDLTGQETSTNGWEFWKFLDEHGQEKYILELRKSVKELNAEQPAA